MNVLAVSALRVEVRPRLGLVRLVDQLAIATDIGLRLNVPTDFWSDGASVPAPLWAVLSASPIQLLVMGAAHDAAYRSDARWTMADSSKRPITRPEADDLARALALWSGCSALDGAKVRWGLGVGGASSWHRKRLGWRP